ncbi:MAG: ABC transporter permease [Dehalococcoidia bacterium]|nr:ABC transporter permease [Dehalococcoidia bacterium]
MVIGVGSVIVLVAVGQGTQKGVESQIRGLGSDLVFVRPGTTQSGGAGGGAGSAVTLTLDDAEAIASAGITGVEAVAPQLSFGAQLVSGSTNQRVEMIGTTAAYPDVRSAAVADGAFISDQDVDSRALTVVLGANVSESLFPYGGAVGESIRMAFGGPSGGLGFDFKVVGVMASQGGTSTGSVDDYVFVPISTVQARLMTFVRNPTGQVSVNQINVRTTAGTDQEQVKLAISDLLTVKHAVATADFTVQTQDDLLGTVSEVTTTMSILLGSIAGISLVVGAIGVMNIMLVSVTERTREIGIRLAVGASSADIVEQFIAEALALTIGGGILGVAVGVGTALWLDGRTISGQEITTSVQAWSALLAFAVAVTIGVLSGIYPAWHASQLDPIAALRAE